jgi:hypothetical protein
MPNYRCADTDEWTPLRVRMRVFLDELEANAESVACLEPGCSSMAEYRGAVDVIRRHIDHLPHECEHTRAADAACDRWLAEEGDS